MSVNVREVLAPGDAGRKMIRHIVRAVIPANSSWPESAGGPVDLPPAFYFIRVDNRSPAGGDVLISLDGPVKQAGDTMAYWDRINAGQKRVRNTGKPGTDAPAKELHILNLGAVQATVWIELALDPIIDLNASDGVKLVDGSGNSADFTGPGLAIKDTSVYNVETTAALGGSATFTGAWRDTLYYNWIGALALTDAAGGTLILDEADAAAPTVTNLVASSPVAATPANQPSPPAAGQFARVVPIKTVLRFNRFRFINGATAQTRLNLQSAMSPVN